MCIIYKGAKLTGAAGAYAPPLFLPRPESQFRAQIRPQELARAQICPQNLGICLPRPVGILERKVVHIYPEIPCSAPPLFSSDWRP